MDPLSYMYPWKHNYCPGSSGLVGYPKYLVVLFYVLILRLARKYNLKCCQDSWDQHIHEKLHEMHNLVGKTLCSYGWNCREKAGLTVYHIVLSRLTHSCLLNNDEITPTIPLTVF